MTGTMKGISRRTFNATIGASLLVSIFPVSGFSFPNNNDTADGLLHYQSNGQISIYSGVGHSSLYSVDNPLPLVKKKLKVSEDKCRFMIGENPAHLPALLTQHLTHLSFSSLITNEKAVNVLSQKIEQLGGNVDQILKHKRLVIIEDKVSEKTRYIANHIKGNGIIVAVKEVTL